MDVNVLRRVMSGLGANVYNQGVTVVVQLVTVPVLLGAWGTQLYGEWLILFAIPAYLSMTDLGFSQSAGNDMTAHVARSDRAGALRVFQSMLGVVYVVSVSGLVLSAVALWRLPLDDWLNFQTMDAGTVRWVLCLFAAEVFVRLIDGATHAGFRASGGYAFHMSLHATVRLLQFAAIWTTTLAGAGPITAAAAYFAVRAATTPAFAALLVHRQPWLSYELGHARMHELRRLFKPAVANMAIPFAQALNIQGMVLVVGTTLGPVAVVTFSTLRTLTRFVLQIILIVSRAAEPEMAAAFGTGNRTLTQSLFVHTLRASLWLALASALALWLFSTDLLRFWTHGEVTMQPALFSWLLGSAVVSVLWYSPLSVLRAANRHLSASTVFVWAAAAAVVLAWLLLTFVGTLANAGFALLLMDIAVAAYMLIAVASLLNINLAASLVKAADPFPLVRYGFARATHRTKNWLNRTQT